MGQFTIRVREMDDGVSEQSFGIPSSWLGNQLEEVEGIGSTEEDGAIELLATKRGREVLLKGAVQTALSVECVRCLEPFSLNVQADVEVLMVPGPGDAGDGGDNGDDLGIEHYQGDEIVLDEFIKDTILLEVPMSPSCGSACKGWDHLHSS